IQERSILVTSRYEEKPIRERCQSNGIKFIPKALASIVPIARSTPPKEGLNHIASSSNWKYDAVLIDDSSSLRNTWAYFAKKRNIRLLSLSSPDDFTQHETLVGPETVIYVDQELGPNRPKGTD